MNEYNEYKSYARLGNLYYVSKKVYKNIFKSLIY